jgi:tryptophan-rich sensory protein
MKEIISTRPSLWQPLLVAAGCAAAVAVIGAVVTNLGPWYAGLHMPPWKPPDALFGPAWTSIFACAALAGALAWRALRTHGGRIALCTWFAINALLNVLWSVLFFRLQRPDWAVLEVGLLWSSIIAVMLAVRRGSPAASWLLLPYLLWVSFAAVLNLAVVKLNPN